MVAQVIVSPLNNVKNRMVLYKVMNAIFAPNMKNIGKENVSLTVTHMNISTRDIAIAKMDITGLKVNVNQSVMICNTGMVKNVFANKGMAVIILENANIAQINHTMKSVFAWKGINGYKNNGPVLRFVDIMRYGTENDVNVKKVTVDTLMENVNIAPKDLLAVVINVIALRDINGLIASGIVENIVESIKYGMENNVFVKRDTEDIKITASLALYTQIVLMENVFAKMDINGLKANGNVINTVEKMKNGMENIVFVSMDILIWMASVNNVHHTLASLMENASVNTIIFGTLANGLVTLIYLHALHDQLGTRRN